MIKHQFVSNIPDGSDATLVRGSNWNQDHIVDDPTALSALLGIIVVSGDPNGTSGAGGDLARDITGQLWVCQGGTSWIQVSRSDRNYTVNVKLFGAVGDGTTDDTVAVRNAITATAGMTLFFPKGKYKISSTIIITTRSHHLIGDFANRFTDGGTEISYTGTGPCFQIGVDNGDPWSASDFNGPQDQVMENLWISHGSPDTTTDTGANFKAGAYGIWDWRGGQIILRNIGIEKFEANFVGINSDINRFYFVISLYSKYGIYIGPRSDQFLIDGLMSFNCDRSITVDGARVVRILNSEFVGCGDNVTSAIEVRKGSGTVHLSRIWFEHLGDTGYSGTDGQSCLSVGEISGAGGTGSGLGTPGSSPNTQDVETCTMEDCFHYTTATGNSGHLKYIASVGFCHSFVLDGPSPPPGVSLSNFDQYVGVQSGQNPTASDTQIEIKKVDSSVPLSKLFVNLGSGTPAWNAPLTGGSGSINYSSGGNWSFRFPTGSPGADRVDLSQQTNAGNIWFNCPTYTGGQTTRFRLARSTQTTDVATGFPTTGTWEIGDRVFIVNATQNGFSHFYCFIAGTPGTWAPAGRIEGRELVPPTLSANQNDYNPTALATARVVLLSASTPVNITGILAGKVIVGTAGSVGQDLIVYNNGANNITLTHQDSSSTATNRIIGRGGANVVLTPNTGVMLYYSPSLTRWVVVTDSL